MKLLLKIYLIKVSNKNEKLKSIFYIKNNITIKSSLKSTLFIITFNRNETFLQICNNVLYVKMLLV